MKKEARVDKCKLRPTERLYTVLEDLDLSFTQKEMEQAKAMWQEGISIMDIAQKMNRDMDEMACLIIDQHRQGQIKKRLGGALGVS